MEKNARSVKNYSEATLFILGFNSLGKILYGKDADNSNIYRAPKQMKYKFG